MWTNEDEFQKHLYSLLIDSRTNILVEFKPFAFLTLSVDIKSEFDNRHEWRELKIINYKNKGRSIQNLWKGIGKLEIMRNLRKRHIPEIDVMDILSLPKEDYLTLSEDIQIIVKEMLNLELVNQLDYKFV